MLINLSKTIQLVDGSHDSNPGVLHSLEYKVHEGRDHISLVCFCLPGT